MFSNTAKEKEFLATMKGIATALAGIEKKMGSDRMFDGTECSFCNGDGCERCPESATIDDAKPINSKEMRRLANQHIPDDVEPECSLCGDTGESITAFGMADCNCIKGGNEKPECLNCRDTGYKLVFERRTPTTPADVAPCPHCPKGQEIKLHWKADDAEPGCKECRDTGSMYKFHEPSPNCGGGYWDSPCPHCPKGREMAEKESLGDISMNTPNTQEQVDMLRRKTSITNA